MLFASGVPTEKRVFPLGTSVTAGNGYVIKDKYGFVPSALLGAGLYTVYTHDGNFVDTFTVTDEQYPAPSFLDNGIIYQVFVDRFARGGNVPVREDAVYCDWDDTPEYKRNEKGELKNNTLFGGTLWGVAEKLDYIAALGAGSIYLSPICKAYSNHKYDTDDYLTVDPSFGGDEALQHLINEAEKRGIKIILDGVFNHVGEHSVYFTSAVSDPASPYRDWFSFSRYPDEYDCWWGCRNLPKTVKNPSFRRFICNSVIPKYMEMGIGGFRLDVVDEYSNEFTHEICAAVKRADERACIIGEVWEDASTKVAYGESKDYFQGHSLDSVTNYPFRDGIIRFFRYGDISALSGALAYQLNHYPKSKLLRLMNTLGTHDTPRIITALAGDERDMSASEAAVYRMTDEEYSLGVQRLCAAYALLVSLPGTPCLYYGDEAGMQGKSDPFNRYPYPWGKEDKNILSFFKKSGMLRKENPVISRGDTEILYSENGVFAFERTFAGKKITVVSFSRAGEYSLDGEYTDILTDKNHAGKIIASYPQTFILQEA